MALVLVGKESFSEGLLQAGWSKSHYYCGRANAQRSQESYLDQQAALAHTEPSNRPHRLCTDLYATCCLHIGLPELLPHPMFFSW